MKNKILNILSILFLVNTAFVHAQVSNDSIPENVHQEKDINDSMVNVAFGEVLKSDLTGAISAINVRELYKKSYSITGEADIIGLVSGYNGNIWGQEPLILIDGVPRTIETIHAAEIESVSVLKGASAVVLYGSKAAKGVILITTKRGQVSPLKVDFTTNSGMFVPKAYPKYLDASSYMTMYNEASRNDGIVERYSEEEIYHTYSGSNPYRYPDLDFYSSEYLRKAYNRTDIVTEIYGGTEKTRYYTNFGMLYNNDLVKYGEHANKNNKNFHLRSNVDMQLNKWLSAATDVGIVFNTRYTGRGDFWGQAATLRPNWVSPLIPTNMLDPNLSSLETTVENSNHVVDGKYLLGGSSTMQDNVFADMLEAGYIKYKQRILQYRQAVKADLGSILDGLSFQTVFAFDYVNYYGEAFRYTYAVYEPTWANTNGEDMVIALTKFNDDEKSTNEYIGEATYDQTMTVLSQFDYTRSFNQTHHVNAKIIGWGYQIQNSADGGHDGSSYHKTSNLNLGMQFSYNFRRKYYIDLAGSQIHSVKLPEDNRRAFSPSITAGWRLNDEPFMKSVIFLDNLKLYASYTILNQDLDIDDYYMYKGYYDTKGGWYTWRDGEGGGFVTTSERGDNPNLTFIQRKEFLAGLSASLFNNTIALNINYFQQETNGLLSQGASTIFPSYYNTYNESFLSYINFNNDLRTGFDFNLNLNNSIGELKYTLGFNGMVYNSEALKRDEVYQEDYQYRAGKPIDATWGYICEGFFVDRDDIDNHATQTFGEVQPGDLKYKDVNEDGIVDDKDAVELGKNGYSAPPFSCGLHITLHWKKLTLFALGTGENGSTRFKNSSYYWVYGDRKYSEVVLGRWTEETKNTATYPRLTTTENSNNFRNSTFWMYDYKRFDLTKIQLTYDLSDNVRNNHFIEELRIYISGEDLLTISKERELLETGIGSAPRYRFYNVGFKVAF